jgi:hypothetical protein
MPNRSNCIPGEPLVRLGEGQGAVLDYNLPQSAAFSAQGSIPLGIPTEWFVEETKVEPRSSWWANPLPERELLVEEIGQGRLSPKNRRLLDPRIVSLVSRQSPATEIPPGPMAPARRAIVATTADRKIVKSSVSTRKPLMRTLEAAPLTHLDIAEAVVEGNRPFLTKTLGGQPAIKFIPKPAAAVPRLFLLEHYKICSYLRDYGAGKTLSTFSLLPGEKTQITISTYRDSETTRAQTENVLDSFSETAADELETLVEEQGGTSDTTSTSDSVTNSTGGGVSVGADVDLFSLVSLSVGGNVESSHEHSTTVATTRETHTQSVNRALSSHVENSSYAREVTVNTTSSQTVTEGEEQSVVRELQNINHSRVLNFVFRQLLQEYLTITYLDRVQVIYTNGYPESIRLFDLNQLSDILPQLIAPEHLEKVRNAILTPYCAVFNHRGEPKAFLEKVDRSYHCPLTKEDVRLTYIRKRLDLADSEDGITVPGVITNVQKNVLATPAVIVEALLGQAEALDCYNQELQGTTVERADLENKKLAQALAIVEAITDPKDKAVAWTSMHVAPVEETSPAEPEEG